MINKNVVLDGVLGFAVGDALGVPVEFLQREKLEKYQINEMIGYGSHMVPEGTWSDDTSMMIATMDSMQECSDINFEDIMHKFSEWVDYAKYTATGELFDIGGATLNAISNYKRGLVPLDCGMKGERENGNGSLMRILPFVYYINNFDFSDDEKVKIINDASSLTHAHEISKLGCKIYADYVTFLLNGYDKFEALDLLRKIDYTKYYSLESIGKYRRLLVDNIYDVPKNDIKSTGYVVYTLEASIWSTLHNNSYEDAVIAAVGLGNDTDTVGAITGAINGILYGRETIPNRWLNKLRKRDYLEDVSTQFMDMLSQKKNRK